MLFAIDPHAEQESTTEAAAAGDHCHPQYHAGCTLFSVGHSQSTALRGAGEGESTRAAERRWLGRLVGHDLDCNLAYAAGAVAQKIAMPAAQPLRAQLLQVGRSCPSLPASLHLGCGRKNWPLTPHAPCPPAAAAGLRAVLDSSGRRTGFCATCGRGGRAGVVVRRWWGSFGGRTATQPLGDRGAAAAARTGRRCDGDACRPAALQPRPRHWRCTVRPSAR